MQVAGALAVAGSLVKGIGGYAAGKANARALKRQAREAENAGAAQSLRVREEARRAIGEQLGAQWSNGMLGGTGTALDALTESQVNAALDAMMVRREAAMKADSYRAQAKQAKREGVMALAEGLLGAGSAAAGMKDDWAQARRGKLPGAATTSTSSDITVLRGGTRLPVD